MKSLVAAFIYSCAIASALQFPLALSPADVLSWARTAVSSISSVTGPKNELIQFHRQLVEIESVTGNEHKIGSFLSSYLESNNFSVERQNVSPERFNVLAYRGSRTEAKVLLTSHMDTVPPYIPYSLRTIDNTIWGRGTVDAKACIAAQTTAALALIRSDAVSPSSLALLFVVGEETKGDGMRAANALGLTWDAVIFGEPTEQKLVSGHKGMLGFTISATGKAAHSGYPWLGFSATELLIKALNKLTALVNRLPTSDKFGETTMNIGLIEGGVAANIVAGNASAEILIRIAAGTPAGLQKEILLTLEETMKDATKGGGELGISWSGQGYAPVDIDHDIKGFEIQTVNYGTDVPNLKGRHKRYLYGPGSIHVAHSDHEQLSVQELEKAVTDYKRLVLASLEGQHAQNN